MRESVRFSVLGILVGAALAAPAGAKSSAEENAARLDMLERRVEFLSNVALEVESLKRQVQLLQGRLDEQQHELDELRRKQQEQYLDLDSRLGSNPPAVAVPEDSLLADPKAGDKKPAGKVDEAKAQKAYDAAYNLLRPENRRYDDAIKAFDGFLKQYPTSVLAPNAQYWLGEANYVTQKNEPALKAFTKLVEQYPESNKIAGALLKIGYIQDAMGKTAEAKKTLNRVVTEFGKTPEAELAKRRLAGMR